MSTMASKRDYYEVLGVERSASHDEIAAAYRKLAIKFHPDKNRGDEAAVERFKACAEAFEVLGDREKRNLYDRYGHAGLEGSARHFTDVNDIFEAFGDMFGDGLFGDLFGGGRGRGRRARRGGDVQCALTIDLFEAARGATKKIVFVRHEQCTTCTGTGAAEGSKPETCEYCGGHGQVLQSSGILRMRTTCPACHGAGHVIRDPCRDCRGSGYIDRRVEREIKIPPGVDTGMRMRLVGEGEPSPSGGQPGDCYCVITVREHQLFERQGPHLICRVPITYSQAALGATIEVPTLEGPEKLEIRAGTQPSQVYRLTGRGMPDTRSRRKGDLHVEVHIEVPTKLTTRQEELLREMAEEEKSNVSPHQKGFLEKLRDYFLPED